MATFQWANDPNPVSLTSQFIVPDENRPNLTSISNLDSIPIVDMSKNKEALIHDISRACEEYGFFQLINHGIPESLCQDVLEVITNFFNLPNEEKSPLLSLKHMEDGKLFRYYINDQVTQERIFMWGEAFFHSWHPVDATCIDNLPINPPNYRGRSKCIGFAGLVERTTKTTSSDVRNGARLLKHPSFIGCF